MGMPSSHAKDKYLFGGTPGMGKILLTGATGRLGTHVLSALVKRKEKVRAILRPGSNRALPRGVECFAWDLSSSPLPHTAFADVDRVIHLAGLVGSGPEPELMLHNAIATKNLVSSCPQNKTKKLVIASSISIYGEYKGQVVDEDFEPRPESPYGKSKLEAEKQADLHKGGIPTALLRFGMIYGPGFEQGYFNVFRFLQNGKMRIFGSGTNHVPLVHVGDAVRAIILSLDANIIFCRQFNIVGDEKPTQEELLKMAANALHAPPPNRHASIIFVQAAFGMGSLMSLLGMQNWLPFDQENIRQLTMDRAYDTSRAHREIGFEAKVKLEDGIKQMARLYLKKNGERAKNGKAASISLGKKGQRGD
jgi:nucleoside-diphosphate-sugar epimerase